MGMLMAMTQFEQKKGKVAEKVVEEVSAPVEEPKEKSVEEPVKRTGGRRKTK